MERLSMPGYNDPMVSQLRQEDIYKSDFMPFFSIYVSKASPRQASQVQLFLQYKSIKKKIYLEILHGES